MSIKDNIGQAVREMLRKDGIVGDGLTKKDAQKTELDRYIEPVTPAAEVATKAEAAPETHLWDAEPETRKSDVEPEITTQPEENVSQQDFYNQIMQETKQAKEHRKDAEKDIKSSQANQNKVSPSIFSSVNYNDNDTEEQTIISRNTIIEGNVRSFANVTIDGSVKGDVQLTKNVAISGKVIGNVECNNAAMSGSQMEGNVSSKGQAKFDRDSLILGNIIASYLDMNGKVKGNIDISGKADFKSDAYIIGDINASTLTVLEGATISGHVNTTFLQDAPSTIFPEKIAMSEIG